MRLCKIKGNICELTNLQASPYDRYPLEIQEEVNIAAIKGEYGCNRGGVRFLSGCKIRSKATAEIEILVNNLPRRSLYVIYYDKKGFYCTVQARKVYLNSILEQPQREE